MKNSTAVIIVFAGLLYCLVPDFAEAQTTPLSLPPLQSTAFQHAIDEIDTVTQERLQQVLSEDVGVQKFMQDFDANDAFTASNLADLLSGYEMFATANRAFISGNDDAVILARYNAGKDALIQITGALSTINIIHGTLKFEQDVSLATNPWADEDFRNFWDRIEGWGSTLGTAAAAVSLTIDEKPEVTGISLAIAGFTKLIGTLFGSQTGSKFEKKAEFVELSRKAYDDIRIRNDLLKSYIEKNKQTLATLQAFHTNEYTQASSNTDSQKEVLVILSGHIGEFDQALDQVLNVFGQYEVIIATYKNNLVNETLKAKFDQLDTNLQTLKDQYSSEVRKFLSLSPQLRQRLTGTP